ncbi:BZ3500_MvSof-1268-A1-R1_Chr3-3g06565 [Microbotryum saponariae]|uniref:BZ3500_MvSof-1268-A1-R1_Chr3-3g06565 protein n=1 Tax=Microbotryum saponariae TaxID=289078 RepID=A0A2X0NAR0_9BASI|nr:BZ3500_MvSof-1268-A1-R1_Chr3-3g06565 [Microbotryum saponariae]SDA04532.1 BZ3501_MvSof-1269-A2-R1_Chr3-2g06252 [Microbotryum saponariae]
MTGLDVSFGKAEVNLCGPFCALPAPDWDLAVHGRCGAVLQPAHRSTRIPNELPSLPPEARHPVMAMMDSSLLKRVEQTLAAFLDEHELSSAVLSKNVELLKQTPAPILCTRGPTCTATVHDLRIRVLEPLLQFLLNQLELKSNPGASPSPHYRLQFRPQDPSQPDGVTLALMKDRPGTCVALMVIHFEEDDDFLSFGPQTNLFARKGECRYHLHHDRPIPLQNGGRSHGAQAILNKLALLMESAVERHPETGEVIVPVRFGMILSTHFGIFAEAIVKPQNPNDFGLIYSPLFHTVGAIHYLDMETCFALTNGSVALMFLASMIDHLAKTPEPPFEVVQRLFGQADPSDAKRWTFQREPRRRTLKTGWTPLSSLEVFSVYHYRVEAKLSLAAWPPRISISNGRMPQTRSGYEAVTFEVVETGPAQDNSSKKHKSESTKYKPCQRLCTLPPALLSFLLAFRPEKHCGDAKEGFLSDLVNVEPQSLLHLVLPQFIAEGGFAVVRAGLLIGSSSVPDLSMDEYLSSSMVEQQHSDSDADTEMHTAEADRLGSSTWIPCTSIPTDQAVVFKSFWDVPSAVHEALFYEHVFPLLPSEARALLPTYHGAYRDSKGTDLGLVLGYGGRPIDEKEVDEVLKKKVADAFRVFDKCGVEHMDRELRNVLVRNDGSLCIIDWNLARLNFDRRFLKYGTEFRW